MTAELWRGTRPSHGWRTQRAKRNCGICSHLFRPGTPVRRPPASAAASPASAHQAALRPAAARRRPPLRRQMPGTTPARPRRAAARPGGPVSAPSLPLALLLLRRCAAVKSAPRRAACCCRHDGHGHGQHGGCCRSSQGLMQARPAAPQCMLVRSTQRRCSASGDADFAASKTLAARCAKRGVTTGKAARTSPTEQLYSSRTSEW